MCWCWLTLDGAITTQAIEKMSDSVVAQGQQMRVSAMEAKDLVAAGAGSLREKLVGVGLARYEGARSLVHNTHGRSRAHAHTLTLTPFSPTCPPPPLRSPPSARL
jgi:hypothetical protein